MKKPVLAIHGGAGRIVPAERARQRAGLARALEAGWAVLARGGSSLDAVVAAVVVLEDDPHFNAGRGAVLTREGTHELDASVMEGAGRRAGAVAAVTRIRNPVRAARAVLDDGAHVLLVGRGAERFARRQQLAFAPADWFRTPARRRALARRLADAHGTVGAVARDRHGHLAAATSTGGVTGQRPGRVGDSPIVGAGTWADDATCAVSGTGDGEVFLRTALAHEVAARMRHRGESLRRAADAALADVARLGGRGGLVAVDRRGQLAMPCNAPALAVAWIGRDGKPRIGR